MEIARSLRIIERFVLSGYPCQMKFIVHDTMITNHSIGKGFSVFLEDRISILVPKEMKKLKCVLFKTLFLLYNNKGKEVFHFIVVYY